MSSGHDRRTSRSRRGLAAGLALLAASACAAPLHGEAGRQRAILISCDGFGADLEARMHARGATPTLDAMADAGAHPRYVVTTYPSKTAVGHAAIWTGAFGDRNGITSNRLPVGPPPAHTVLETRTAFDAGSLTAEPIWLTAARHGRPAVVLPAPFSGPAQAWDAAHRGAGLAPGTLAVADLYAAPRTPDRVIDEATRLSPASGWRDPAAAVLAQPSAPQLVQDLVGAGQVPQPAFEPCEIAFTVEDTPLWGLFLHDPRVPGAGANALLVRADKQAPGGVVLHADPPRLGAGAFGGPIPVAGPHGPGQVYLRLFDLAPDASRFTLYVSQVNHPLGAGKAGEALVAGLGPLVYGGAEASYAAGELGEPLARGGDGTAEARYLETVAFSLWSIRNAALAAERRPGWDLIVGYVPFPDEAEHLWYGDVDPTSPAYRPALARRLLPDLEAVVRMVDQTLGAIRDARPPGTTLAVVSDHGFQGVDRVFFPNTVLRDAGLLAAGPDGQVDLSHTQVLYPPEDGEYLVVNTRDRKGGIVPTRQRVAVVDAALAALRAARDGAGRPILAGFFDPELADPLLGLGGPRGGDLYLDPVPGVELAPEVAPTAVAPADPVWSGTHGMNPLREGLHAICFLEGPGVAQGVQAGPIRVVDEAPTLCRLLGLPAPAQAVGHPVPGLFEGSIQGATPGP